MAKKSIQLSILVFGMMLIGCDSIFQDFSLNGTWVSADSQYEFIMDLNFGSFENSAKYSYTNLNYSGPVTKGAYTTNGNIFNSTVTHYHGNYIAVMVPNSQPGTGWKTIDEYYSIWENYYRQAGITEDQINNYMNSIKNPSPSTTTFSVEGNKLTLTTTRSDGQTSAITYTKR